MEIPTGELKDIYPIGVLTHDEQSVINGASYDSIPDKFQISSIVRSASLQVWDAFESHSPIKESEAIRRASAYFEQLLSSGNEMEREEARKYFNQRLEAKKETEYGRLIYRRNSDILIGQVQKGNRRSIIIENEYAGKSDISKIIEIHNHVDDMTFSERDVINTIVEDDIVPLSFIKLVVGPTRLHLLFPTIDTPRQNLFELYNEFKKDFSERYRIVDLPKDEYMEAQKNLVSEAARKYKLGFYSSEKTSDLIRF